LLVAASLSACEEEVNPEAVPEVAEVAVEPGRVEVGPGRVVIDLPETRLRDAELPFSDDDQGKMILANGFLVGERLPDGFFLRTEDDNVLFVETTDVETAVPTEPGDGVRVVGPLRKATQLVFQGWKTDALGDELQGEFDLVDIWYVDAAAVMDV
jgi:hypothetical protein